MTTPVFRISCPDVRRTLRSSWSPARSRPRASRPTAALLSRRSDRPRSRNRRTRPRHSPTTSSRCTRWLQPVRRRQATSLPASARRTSTRSTRCPIRAGSRTGSAPEPLVSTNWSAVPLPMPPPDPSQWILTREKTSGAHPGFTAQRREGPDLLPGVRSAVLPGRRDRRGDGCHQDLLGAGLQPGGVVSHHVRSQARHVRSQGDDQAAVWSEDAVLPGRPERNSGARGEAAGRHISRRRRPADSWQDPRQLSSIPARDPTTRTTSFRTSIVASCARFASSAPGRT